jgi:hypothetical protein
MPWSQSVSASITVPKGTVADPTARLGDTHGRVPPATERPIARSDRRARALEAAWRHFVL